MRATMVPRRVELPEAARNAEAFHPSPHPAEGGEDRGDDTAVDLHRVIDHQPAILDELEEGDQRAAEEAVEEDMSASIHSTGPWRGRQPPASPGMLARPGAMPYFRVSSV